MCAIAFGIENQSIFAHRENGLAPEIHRQSIKSKTISLQKSRHLPDAVRRVAIMAGQILGLCCTPLSSVSTAWSDGQKARYNGRFFLKSLCQLLVLSNILCNQHELISMDLRACMINKVCRRETHIRGLDNAEFKMYKLIFRLNSLQALYF